METIILKSEERLNNARTNVTNLEHQVTRCDERIAECKRRRQIAISKGHSALLLKRHLRKMNDPALANALHVTLSEENFDPADSALGKLNDQYTFAKTSITRYQQNIVAHIENREDYRKQLAAAKQELTRLLLEDVSTLVLHLDTLKTEITQIPDVKQVEFDRNDEIFHVYVTFHRMGMYDVADNNEYMTTLPEMTLDIRIPTDMYSRPTYRLYSPINVKGYSGEFIPHPHWIDNSGPCWGTFGSSITELANEGDIVGLVMMIRLFLQSCNTDDDAGKYGHGWNHALNILLSKPVSSSSTLYNLAYVPKEYNYDSYHGYLREQHIEEGPPPMPVENDRWFYDIIEEEEDVTA